LNVFADTDNRVLYIEARERGGEGVRVKRKGVRKGVIRKGVRVKIQY
jgi:hypothetical protein